MLLALWTIDSAKVIVPSSKTTAIIENLTPASAYHFRILAENSIGMSEPSDVIQITTQEEGNFFFLFFFQIFCQVTDEHFYHYV